MSSLAEAVDDENLLKDVLVVPQDTREGLGEAQMLAEVPLERDCSAICDSTVYETVVLMAATPSSMLASWEDVVVLLVRLLV